MVTQKKKNLFNNKNIKNNLNLLDKTEQFR